MKRTMTILVLAALAAVTLAPAWAGMPPIVAGIPPIADLRDSVGEVREITLLQLRLLNLYKDPGLAAEAGRAADALDKAADGCLKIARNEVLPPLHDLVDELRDVASNVRAAGSRYASARGPSAALGALAALDDGAKTALAVLKRADEFPPLID